MAFTAEQTRALSLDLMRAFRFTTSGGRESWLGPLLRAVEQGCGASLAYLAEAGEGGWVRTAWREGFCEEKRERNVRGLARRLLSAGDDLLLPVIRPGSGFQQRYDGWDGIRPGGYAACSIPLGAPRRAWLVALQEDGGARFDTGTLELLRLGAEAAAAATGNQEQVRALEELALTDDLTHIPNYRCLRTAVDQEIARADRLESVFTLVMVDMDNLKIYNQHHGHLAGSEVLRDLARILRENIRRTDLAAKYGGDEFVLILPQTLPEGGVALCRRIRERIGAELRGCAGEALSCSFGVAGFPEDGRDFRSLVRAADEALFAAKQEGRDAIVCLARAEKGRRREAA